MGDKMKVKCKECGYVNNDYDKVCKKCFVPITIENEKEEIKEIKKERNYLVPFIIKYALMFSIFIIIFMVIAALGLYFISKKEITLNQNLYNFIIIVYLVITNSSSVIIALNLLFKNNYLYTNDIKKFSIYLSSIYMFFTIVYIILSYFLLDTLTSYIILIANTLTILSLLPYLIKKFKIMAK